MVVSERSNQDKSANSEDEEDAVASGEAEEVPEDDYVDNSTESKPMLLRNDIEEDFEVSEIQHSEDNEVSNTR